MSTADEAFGPPHTGHQEVVPPDLHAHAPLPPPIPVAPDIPMAGGVSEPAETGCPRQLGGFTRLPPSWQDNIRANPLPAQQTATVLSIYRDVLPDVVRYKPRLLQRVQQGSRATGIERAWRDERQLVEQTGQGSQDWTPAEIQELLLNGRIQGYVGHHINNVADYPQWAGDPRNIIFLQPDEHLQAVQGHRGRWKNRTSGHLIDRHATARQRHKNP